MGGAPDHVFLVDNGSLAPAAVRSLRALAEAVSARIGRAVEPVSVAHADKISREALDGRPAEVFEAALHARAAKGARRFAVVPLFIGPSRALTEYLPERVEVARRVLAELDVRVAAPLHTAGDDRLARMLADWVRETEGPVDRVAVVDHGSPTRAVTAVRDEVAAQLGRCLEAKKITVAPCSMERRAGEAYAFNEPLLAGLLRSPGWRESRVLVAQLFLQPGRHAGPDGDIARVCAEAMAEAPELRVQRTPLLGEHPGLPDLLAERARTVL